MTSKSVSALEQRTLPEPSPAGSQDQPHDAARSPDERPLIVIEPSGAWGASDLRALWTYRELLYYLTWRDVKVRYKQTLLGVAWVVVQPLLTTFIFTVFLGVLVRVPYEGVSYPLFVYAGLLPWTFFSGAVLTSGVSLVGNTHLITKIYFPRLIIPAAATAARVVDFGIGLVLLAGMMILYRVPLTSNLLMLPVLAVLLALLAFGVGALAAVTNVKYRDVGVALPVLVQLWMFVSPIIYPARLVPPRWQTLYALNPLVGIAENFRAAVFGGQFDWRACGESALVTCGLLVLSTYMFRRAEKTVADVI